MEVEKKTWGDCTWAFCPTHDIDYLKKWRKGIVYREVVQRAVLNSESESIGRRGARVGMALAGVVLPGDPVCAGHQTDEERSDGPQWEGDLFF